jgi:sugar/nucleoside kinase (ribokinase family)
MSDDTVLRLGIWGNLTLDELDRNGVRIVRPGGSALFSSLSGVCLGAKVSIVSNVGKDYPRRVLAEIKRKGINITGVKGFESNTTRFRISYSRNSRSLEVIHPGERLVPNRSSAILDAIHLGAVFGEIGLDMLTHARQRCKFLSVDVQGLLRAVDARGRVRLVRRNIDRFLSECDLLKATEQEARVLAPGKTLLSSAKLLLRKGADYAIITRGERGALLVGKDGSAVQMPSIPKGRVVDPTGAGDIFIGSWVTTFQSVGDARWGGAVGAAFASLSVRGIGLSKFRFSKSELFRRASWAYNHSKHVSN